MDERLEDSLSPVLLGKPLADVETASPLRFSSEDELKTQSWVAAEKAEDEEGEEGDEDEEGGTPWYCSRAAFAVVVLLLVLLLTALLLAFGRSRLSAAQADALEERLEVLEEAGGEAAGPETLQGHVIDAPRRCGDGFRFFRGKCRRLF